jgi:tetratricopeptide (TPR) repeat protein
VRSLQAAQKEEPNDGEVIQLTGLSLYLAGKPADAITYLEKVQTWYPRANIDAAYVQTKKYSEGRAAFAKMFGVPPDAAAAYLFAARMLLRLDFGPIAEEYGLKAVSLDPKLPLAHQLFGELFSTSRKSPKLSRNSSRKWPSIPPIPSHSINSRMPIRAFRSSMKPRSFCSSPSGWTPLPPVPTSSWEKCWRRRVLAVRALQRAINMDPNNSISYQLLGQAYRDLGRSEDAERELKLAEQLQIRDASRQQ